MKIKESSFFKYYKKSFSYIFESKNYIYLAVALFFISGLIGFIFNSYFSSYLNPLIKELIEKTSGLGPIRLILFIFSNNVSASLFGMVSGVFVGLFPISNIVLNGILLGYVLALAVSIEGGFSFFRLIPHGVFELPAIFISIGLGIKIGMFVFVRKGKRMAEFKRRSFESLRVFVSVVLPLLVIAAIIEGLSISFFK